MQLRMWNGLLLSALALGACGGGGSGDEDSGPRDGGSRVDAGPGQDSGGGEQDAGQDAGTPGTDSGPGVDAGPVIGCEDLTLPALSTEEIVDAVGGVSPWNGMRPQALGQPAGTTDLYVATQEGRIYIVRGRALVTTPFLDLSGTGANRIETPGGLGSEVGLLSMAFHPNYPTDPRFYVYYTSRGGRQDVLAEYHRNATNPDRADTDEIRLFHPDDGENNHNGGTILFGRDGRLYLSVGDGGGGEDAHGPDGNGLNVNSPFGKIHRFNVDDPPNYVAPGNPALGGIATIWAYGLRNPWRMSFDRATGDLYIGDVGQYTWEEIDIQPAASTGGENYGWRVYEGYADGFADGDDARLVPVHTPPVLMYNHTGTTYWVDGADARTRLIGGAAVVGGYVYRGTAVDRLQGWYIFGDYGSATFAAFRYCDGTVQGVQRARALDGSAGGYFASFGEGNDGELYILGETVVRIIGG